MKPTPTQPAIPLRKNWALQYYYPNNHTNVEQKALARFRLDRIAGARMK